MINKVNKYYNNEFYLIKQSKMFDEEWFIQEYSINNTDPIIYYLQNWKHFDLNPSPKFNSREYLKLNGDVEKSGMNPLVHYIKYGIKENRLLR